MEYITANSGNYALKYNTQTFSSLSFSSLSFSISVPEHTHWKFSILCIKLIVLPWHFFWQKVTVCDIAKKKYIYQSDFLAFTCDIANITLPNCYYIRLQGELVLSFFFVTVSFSLNWSYSSCALLFTTQPFHRGRNSWTLSVVSFR